MGTVKYRLKIWNSCIVGSFRLIQQAPCNDTGMILIAGDHFFHCPQMIFQKLRCSFFLKKCCLFAGTCFRKVHQTLKKSYCRNFINDQETFPVSHLIDFFTVRIMRSTEGIGPNPFHTLKITFHHTDIKSTSYDITVLMLSKASQIYRFAIQQNTGSFHFNSTDTDFLMIFINHFFSVHNFHNQLVQVSLVNLPQMCIFYFQDTFFAFCRSNLASTLIIQFHNNRMISCGDNRIRNLRICTFNCIICGNVKNRLFRNSHQINRSLKSCIIEEIKIRFCHLLSIGKSNCRSTWNISNCQFIIYFYNNFIFRIIPNHIRNIRTKWKETTLMLRNLHTIHKNLCPMGCTAKTYKNILAFPFSRNKNIFFIPHITCVFAGIFVCIEILETCRNRNHFIARDTVRPAQRLSLCFPVQTELPHTIHGNHTSGNRCFRI